ncbi:aconitase X swivel domain-containing protein [Intrasporangium calvum]|uniref:Predicted aconitase subunit 2 n=1 Tax=Intrasporangium calvum (strain ATCC 23552 / DSM 43043 / JCM 3097 / NBRC 12989 / NCIMB 10167 / NRRL B-3866 / 7 KIP) TaxID=710696 RepID=E6SD53_INTC7|nr:DUF126 domain-containing protein [Intrasporangium calvum]ADU49671.1 predicted aconitase subunit 2 [Intrasporangium calvum DSM 43043]
MASMTGRALRPGSASGALLVLDEPLSFWGGSDLAGTIIDTHHPQHGQSFAGRVLAMRSGRGSSSSSYVLAEQLRRGTGPLAIVLAEPDAIIVLGALVAHELYGHSVPVVLVPPDELARLRTGDVVEVCA